MTDHFADIYASGQGAARVHQRLFGTDIANGPVTAGDLALLADAVYEPKGGDGNNKDYIPADLNGCGISSWTCVRTFNFQGDAKGLLALVAPDSPDPTEMEVNGFFAALFTDGTNGLLGKNGQHYVLAFRGTAKRNSKTGSRTTGKPSGSIPGNTRKRLRSWRRSFRSTSIAKPRRR